MLSAKTRFLILILALLLVCSACGPKEKLATTLRINLIADSEDIFEEILSEELISDLLFQSLTDIDPEKGEAIPALASSWEVDETGTKWTFYLRDDVFWVGKDQDGKLEKVRPVNADDFILNTDTTSVDMDEAMFLYPEIVKNRGKHDDFTLWFELSEPMDDFHKLASRIKWSGPEADQFANGVYGAWDLSEWAYQDSVVLNKNPFSTVAADGIPDEIVFTWLDEETAIQKFQDGELDVIEVSGEGTGWTVTIPAGTLFEVGYFAVQEEKSDAFTQLVKVGEGKRKFIAEYIPSRMEEAERLLDAAFDHLAVHKCEEGVPEALKALQICGWMADYPTPENYAKPEICSARANLMLENIDPAIENLKAALEKDIPDCDRKEIKSVLGDLYLRRAQNPCSIWDIDFNKGWNERGYPIDKTDTYEGDNREIAVNWRITSPYNTDECRNRLVIKWLYEDVLQCFHEIIPEEGVKIFGSTYYEDDGGYLEEGTWEIQIWDGAKMIFSEQIPID